MTAVIKFRLLRVCTYILRLIVDAIQHLTFIIGTNKKGRTLVLLCVEVICFANEENKKVGVLTLIFYQHRFKMLLNQAAVCNL